MADTDKALHAGVSERVADGIRQALDELGILGPEDVGIEWAVPVRIARIGGDGHLHHRSTTLCSPGLDPAVKRDLLAGAVRRAEEQR